MPKFDPDIASRQGTTTLTAIVRLQCDRWLNGKRCCEIVERSLTLLCVQQQNTDASAAIRVEYVNSIGYNLSGSHARQTGFFFPRTLVFHWLQQSVMFLTASLIAATCLESAADNI